MIPDLDCLKVLHNISMQEIAGKLKSIEKLVSKNVQTN